MKRLTFDRYIAFESPTAVVRALVTVRTSCLIVFGMIACSVPPNPSETGGHIVTGSEGIADELIDPWSLSPDGELAAFTLAPPPDAVERDPYLARLQHFAVVPTNGGAPRRIGIEPDFPSEVLLAHRELMFGPPVWSANGDTLFLARARGLALYAFLGDSAPTWRIGRWEGPDVAWTSPNDHVPDTVGNFTISQNKGTIEIRDRAPGGGVFRYDRGLISRDVHLHQLRLTERERVRGHAGPARRIGAALSVAALTVQHPVCATLAAVVS